MLLCFNQSYSAQLIDSIQNSLVYKPKFLFKLDTRNSFVTSTATKVKGVKVGVLHNKKFAYGVGYNWMSNDFYINRVDSTNLRMNYISVFTSYTFFQSKRWTLALPIQVGFGQLRYRDQEREILNRTSAFIWEPSMTMEYKFLRYFGVGFGAGYRIVVKSSTPIKERFTAPIYIFKFNVYFQKIYSDVVK